MKGSIGVAFCCLLVAAVVLEEAHETAAVTCNPTCPCKASDLGHPSPGCCAKLKEQEPCLCQFMKNPAIRQYIDSPNGRKISSTCGVRIPANC